MNDLISFMPPFRRLDDIVAELRLAA